MDSATAAVKNFQSKYGIFDIPGQSRQYFEVISKVSSEVLGSEIKYELLRSNLNANSEVLKTAQEELNILEKKLREIINRKGDNPVLLEYGKLPELGEMYWKLVAEREIKQELLRFIVPIYEQSKMEEKKALSIIKVIDPPDLPVKKAWPPRAAYLVVAILLATVLLLLGTVVFLIYRQNEAYFKQSLLA
jgi:capsule polysaccharide export protein KpsE/RkpR